MTKSAATSNRRHPRTIVRFAPSPNGRLHLGHVKSALVNWRFAQAQGGLFVLRIEDIDTTRARPEFERAIFDDLAWLGLDWPEPVRRQSEHFDDYAEALAELRRLGLIYPAFLSRAEAADRVRRIEAGGQAWPRDPDGAPHYPGKDRTLSDADRQRRVDAGEPHTWRLDMRAALTGLASGLTWREQGSGPAGESGIIRADPMAWGDVILARRDVPASYHLSVTVDDALQRVSHVIRGQDLFASTAVHRLLQSLLGLPEPLYHHHQLVCDATGRKLSKSDGDMSLDALRADGMTAEQVIAMAGGEAALGGRIDTGAS